MMSKNLASLSRNVTASRAFSAQHAHKSAAAASKLGELKATTLPSGLTIASVQSDSPLARVAVVVRAGSRYEPASQLGIAHTLRNAAGLATERYTAFGISRNIEYHGGRLSVTGTRDTITYLLEAHQDDDILERNLSILTDIVTRPAFKPWEISDSVGRLQADLAVFGENPAAQLAEALHAAAFKGGLRKSLYCPAYNVGKHTADALAQYVKARFVASNTAVLAIGLEQDDVQDLVVQNLVLPSTSAPKCKSSFIGGERHLDSNSPLTYVALAAEGAGLKNPKDVLALSLLQSVLGTGAQIISDATSLSSGRLGKAVRAALGGKVSADAVAVSAFNFAYEETGLFGINLIAPSGADITGLVKAAVKEFRAVANSVTEKELTAAKKNLKNRINLQQDEGANFAVEIAQQLLLSGQTAVTPADLAKQVDALSLADVKSVSSKLLKNNKLALATVGQNFPYLDDILEGSQ